MNKIVLAFLGLACFSNMLSISQSTLVERSFDYLSVAPVSEADVRGVVNGIKWYAEGDSYQNLVVQLKNEFAQGLQDHERTMRNGFEVKEVLPCIFWGALTLTTAALSFFYYKRIQESNYEFDALRARLVDMNVEITEYDECYGNLTIHKVSVYQIGNLSPDEIEYVNDSARKLSELRESAHKLTESAIILGSCSFILSFSLCSAIKKTFFYDRGLFKKRYEHFLFIFRELEKIVSNFKSLSEN